MDEDGGSENEEARRNAPEEARILLFLTTTINCENSRVSLSVRSDHIDIPIRCFVYLTL